MSAELLLCISQEEIYTPYQFKITGINVYSIEEAAYHCYYHWKQSYNEFTSQEFLEWIREVVGLPFLASKILIIDQIQSIREKLIAFFNLFDYFNEIQLADLKTQLGEWEKRREWERLKEQGDYLIQKDEPQKAVAFYKKALDTQENAQLLNNMGAGLMMLSRFQEAVSYLSRALEQDPECVQIWLNMAEARIFSHSFEQALRALKSAEDLIKEKNGEQNKDQNKDVVSDINALYGELNFQAGNIRYSIEYFERAIALNGNAQTVFRLADVYVKLRQYDKAVENLNRVKVKDKDFLIKLAGVYFEADNIPSAIKSIERALISNNNDTTLWTKLAMYHRLDYDLNRANSAIIKALSIDKNNENTLLEHARIKKAMGKTKEYQLILKRILDGFKRKYRETAGL